MSKNKQRPPQQVKVPATGNIPAIETEKKDGGFHIPYPYLILALVVILVYARALSLGVTELDDTIFINEFRVYNEDISNLLKSFTRGLFDAVKDPYYRPLFSDLMILNYRMSGEEPGGYHAVNLLLHLVSVLLLYRLFLWLEINKLHAFLLSMIFAVHPALAQAVAWIPGRNDTLLAIFVLSFLINTVRYTESGRLSRLLLSGLFLLLAFFTKETAVFAAPAAFMLLILYMGKRWNEKPMLAQYGTWVGCFAIWFMARTMATIQPSGIASAQAMTDFVHRLPVILQYIGKVVLPFNLSIFPIQQDTVIYYGVVALALLVMAVVLYKPATRMPALGAIGVFLIFLMPALLVPANLNQQTFEHRLYLPVIGMLLLLPQSAIFRNRLTDKQLTMAVLGVCGVFAFLNIRHQGAFQDPRTFWTQAVETSPNSAYANMMLAARLDKAEGARSEELFRKAYRLNPKEKYLNFYLAEMLQHKDSVLASEPYLMAEKAISDYVLCDFYLARVAMEKGEKVAAIGHIERFLTRDSYNPMANNNLLLLYIDLGQTDKARIQAQKMKRIGMAVPANIASSLGI